MNAQPDISGRDIVLGQGSAPIPERLLLAHARGEVLFVVGAGVSKSAGLPNFRGLVLKVYEELDQAVHPVISRISSANDNGEDPDLSTLLNGQKAEIKRFQGGEYDVVLGMLERRLEGRQEAQSKVRQKVREILRPDGLQPAPMHQALMRLSDRGGAVTIITTNFDLLLEDAAKKTKSTIQTYALGGIPRPSKSQEFTGVMHIHGALDRNPSRTLDLILSDQDFGEFYLRRRIVSDLIYDAARLYNLVFVGYSASDPPMRYLLNAVSADRPRFGDLKELFIFVGMDEDDPVELADWKARGITPIRYTVQGNDHSQLQDTLRRWAEFSAVNGRKTRVDRELKRIVKIPRAEATDEDQDLFDHFIRRSETTERIRLSRLSSKQNADMGWLRRHRSRVVGGKREGQPMRLLQLSLNARDQGTVGSTAAFLESLLEEKGTIEWALRLGSNDIVKRIATLWLLNRKEGIALREPWRSAWRIIEESWNHPTVRYDLRRNEYIVKGSIILWREIRFSRLRNRRSRCAEVSSQTLRYPGTSTL